MGKRKPKLYRMKQFDVSPKKQIFLFTENVLSRVPSPSRSTFYYAENP